MSKSTTIRERDGRGPVAPPPVTVRTTDLSFTLEAYTYCWQAGNRGVCADGLPPPTPELQVVDGADEIIVEFPVTGFELQATTEPTGVECGRLQTEPLEQVGDTTFRLVPQGPADDYRVTIFGRGRGMDFFVAFRWRTPVGGVLPVPDAHATVVHDVGEGPRWLGADIILRDLRTTPSRSRADVTLTGADGTVLTAEALPGDDACVGGEGWLHLVEPQPSPGRLAGSAPFDMVVDLVLDGERFVGPGRWPDDVDPECDPCIRLDFDPPLPALTTAESGGGGVDATAE